MEIRPLTQVEQKYTYRQGTQLEGQTGNIRVSHRRFWKIGERVPFHMVGSADAFENR